MSTGGLFSSYHFDRQRWKLRNLFFARNSRPQSIIAMLRTIRANTKEREREEKVITTTTIVTNRSISAFVLCQNSKCKVLFIYRIRKLLLITNSRFFLYKSIRHFGYCAVETPLWQRCHLISDRSQKRTSSLFFFFLSFRKQNPSTFFFWFLVTQ